MPFTVTPTVDQVLQDIKAFVTSIVPANTPVIKGLANRTPMPLPAVGFVVITPLFQDRLAYNFDSYSGNTPSTLQELQSVRIDLQIDVYGVNAGSWASMLTTLWKDEYACDLLQYCQPLYMDDARMVPLTNSEAQYEERWTLTATAQYNPVVSIAQEFADALDITLVDVNEKYPT